MSRSSYGGVPRRPWERQAVDRDRSGFRATARRGTSGSVEEILVRPVEASEREAWGALEAAERWLGGQPLSQEMPHPKTPWLWLGAWRGVDCVGRLRASWPQAEMVTIDEVAVAAGERGDEIARGLFGALAEHLPDPQVRVYAEDNEEDRPLRRWLEPAAFEVSREKVVTGCALPLDETVELQGLSVLTLDELGEVAFAAALEAAARDDPFQPDGPRDAIAELRDLVAYAGDAFDPKGWYVVRDGEETVGVVLPQVFGDAPEEGSLFYVGVAPPFRGRGLGRLLHAFGLQALGRRGAKGYVGSSDVRNAPMLHIFEQNGCRELARQLFYLPRVRTEAGQARERSGRP